MLVRGGGGGGGLHDWYTKIERIEVDLIILSELNQMNKASV